MPHGRRHRLVRWGRQVLGGRRGQASGDPAPRGAHSGTVASPAGMDQWLAASLFPRPESAGGSLSPDDREPALPGAVAPLGAGRAGSRLV